MKISTPLKDFICQNRLTFKAIKQGSKTISTFAFSRFNMVFTDMVIQVVVEPAGATTKVSVSQIAVLKGSAYRKLKSILATGRFEKEMKKNLKKIKSGLGGI